MAEFRIDYSNRTPSNNTLPAQKWPRIVLALVLIGAGLMSGGLIMGTVRDNDEIETLRRERDALLLRCDSLHAAKIQNDRQLQHLLVEIKRLKKE
ncbi:MAG: hypothetical protein MUE30_02715 [Spirosomaceae bacterium]|jgi:hypothetical protein|nr:hypothetical protein [Spirosomataceae bacterium]